MRTRPLLAALAAASAALVAVPSAAAPVDRAGSPQDRGRAQDTGRVGVELTELGRYTAPDARFNEGGAEIVAYEASTRRLFVANGSEGTLDVIDVADPADPQLVEQVQLDEYGAGINGVGAADGLVGVAVSPEDEQGSPGRAVFLDAQTLEVVQDVEVGFLPDALLFSPDGRTAVVANEGEPASDYSIDPPGTVSVIDITTFEVSEVGFDDLAMEDIVSAESFRTFGPSAGDLSADIEPENVTFDEDGSTAYVTLQENNAIAEVDLTEGTLSGVFALGFKDWSAEGPYVGNGFDASNEDGEIAIRDWPVLSFPHPDALAAYHVRGETFLVTANEGDARDYDAYSEEERLGDIGFCDRDLSYDGLSAEELEQEDNLGRLNVTTTNGYDEEGDCLDQAYAYGARSFSVYTPDGELVYDSGSDFEDVTAAELGREGFNANNDESGDDAFDSRSDDKGPEPEGLAVGTAYGDTYAFVGLERVGGVMTYQLNDPAAPRFVDYTTGRDFEAATAEESVDLGPEGVLFVGDEDSPTGRPLVVLSHEVTGTTTIYQVDPLAPGDQVDMPRGGVAAGGGSPSGVESAGLLVAGATALTAGAGGLLLLRRRTALD